jgi:Tat protein translocase TatB subunit
MFNVGSGELIVIMIIALVVLGPDKLPEAARKAGVWLAEFRRISAGFQQELHDAMDTATRPPTGNAHRATPERPDPALKFDHPDALTLPPLDLTPPTPPLPTDQARTARPAPIEIDGPTDSFT